MHAQLKPYASIPDLINKLEDRGMKVDAEVAKQWLSAVGYYRLSGYWYIYREPDGTGGQLRSDYFMDGTSFADVAQLYEFDRKLRGHVLDGLERVEVALRSSINEELGSLGPLAYRDSANFRPEFNHDRWLDTADWRIKRAARSSSAVRHYQNKYGGQFPLWVIADELDFADCSRLFEGLPAKRQWAIADRLGLAIDRSRLSKNQRKKVSKNHPLARWLEQLSIVRNTCAHHSRLWNRSFIPVGTAAVRSNFEMDSLPEGQSERLYGAVLLTAKILTMASPGSAWALRFPLLVRESLETINGREASELGCPAGWESEILFADP